MQLLSRFQAHHNSAPTGMCSGPMPITSLWLYLCLALTALSPPLGMPLVHHRKVSTPEKGFKFLIAMAVVGLSYAHTDQFGWQQCDKVTVSIWVCTCGPSATTGVDMSTCGFGCSNQSIRCWLWVERFKWAALETSCEDLTLKTSCTKKVHASGFSSLCSVYYY